MNKEQTIEDVARNLVVAYDSLHIMSYEKAERIAAICYEASGIEALQAKCDAYEEAISVLHQVAYAGFAHIPPRVIKAINEALAAHKAKVGE